MGKEKHPGWIAQQRQAAASTARMHPLPTKGAGYRHILRTFIRDGREWSYHATKGWRSRRV